MWSARSKCFALAFFSFLGIEILVYPPSKSLRMSLSYFTGLFTDAESNNTYTLNASLPLNVTLFVTYDRSIIWRGALLGNQIFSLAVTLYVSELSGRKPALWKSPRLHLENVFHLDIAHIEDPCPCHVLHEKQCEAYDPSIEKINYTHSIFYNRSIIVGGYRQSWRYLVGIEKRLRRQLTFRNEIQRFAEQFLERTVPKHWHSVGFVRVGIHIRRGDFVDNPGGFTVAGEQYFFNAMKYFTDKYSRVQFIVASNDMKWVVDHITIRNITSPHSVNITYSIAHSAGQDMAILSMCDHVIMSTGTYGWWSAWLAKGTTIYYSNWPRKGSSLEREFVKEDFFPANWIPMNDSYVPAGPNVTLSP